MWHTTLFDVTIANHWSAVKRWLTLTLLLLPGQAMAADSFDVVVYGGTAGGVTAAVQARRMGKTAVLMEPGKHLGGMTTGGLGATDIGVKESHGGLAREFYRRVGKEYHRPEMWAFEPHVAEKVIEDLVREAGVTVVRGERLDLKNGVAKESGHITSITMESGRQFQGKMFIDATYEGDLLAKAGVSYHVGRESFDTYGERFNGFQGDATNHQFRKPIDPYVVPGDPKSGLLLGIVNMPKQTLGDGDKRVQAYNYRLCMTDNPANQIPFPKPAGYDPLRYELLLRYLKAGVFDVLGNNQKMPNRKTDTNNNGAFASDNIGMNYEYPDGDYATREKIIREHVTYHQGLMWFLVNDPRVPEEVRKEMSRWGLARDEFVDNGGWPHQLYVREARRMISDYVMIEQNCFGKRTVEDSVGLGSYGMDSHNVQRYVRDGVVRNEGNTETGRLPGPYAIAYRSIRPKEAECENLLVPVCVSSSHIGYGSIRMEPVYMQLGQAAATAACQAIDAGVSAQRIDVKKLQARLLADGQILDPAIAKAAHDEAAPRPAKKENTGAAVTPLPSREGPGEGRANAFVSTFAPKDPSPPSVAPSPSLSLKGEESAPAKRWNIVWILGEDMGPELGCYGEPLVKTPNLDRLAREGARFTQAFTTAPVCSSSRSAMITGMYQTTIGCQDHRSHRGDAYRLPEGVPTLMDLFRQHGYYTANVITVAPGVRGVGKTDFNFKVPLLFDGKDWKDRRPNQPFFAQVNFNEPHRGSSWPPALEAPNPIDPDKIKLPPYYPDVPAVRADFANYLDAIQVLDTKVGAVLKRLEDEGLADNTVVVFIGDNGQCTYRGKQFLYDLGIHIPLIVRWPGRIKPGTVREDLVSAIDISAAVLRAAGIDLPPKMQGRDFLAPDAAPRKYVFAARDRCDETIECMRCARNKQFKYIRNYCPERPYAQSNRYKDTQYPPLNIARQMNKAGKLTPAQALFFAPSKPAEELYDLAADPHELRNLAASTQHAVVLKDLREALDTWMDECGDKHVVGATTN